jgi:tetratricopeptide (TPR) repeat protein
MKSPIVVALILAIAFAIGAFVLRCDRLGGSDIPLIRSGAEYSDYLAKAEGLSRPVLEKVDAGQSLNDEDQSKLDQSIPLIKGLIAFRPNTFGLYVLLGKIYQVKGEHRLAIAELDKGAQLMWNTSQPEVRATLAETHHLATLSFAAMGEHESAANSAMKSLELAPGNPIYNVDAAGSYLQLGQLANARRYIDRALKSDPDFGPAKQMLKLIEAAEAEAKTNPDR